MINIHFVHSPHRVVCTLTVVPDMYTCWVEVSALQHGPVLNHPLGTIQILTNGLYMYSRWCAWYCAIFYQCFFFSTQIEKL